MENKMRYGERLKNAREALGLTLSEISYELKINLKVLEKIESSETEELPKPAFTKGFIKNYCKYLKISPGLVLSEYEMTLGETDKKISTSVLSAESEKRATIVSKISNNKLFPFFAFGFAVLMLVPLYSFLAPSGKSFKVLVEEPVEVKEVVLNLKDEPVEIEVADAVLEDEINPDNGKNDIKEKKVEKELSVAVEDPVPIIKKVVEPEEPVIEKVVGEVQEKIIKPFVPVGKHKLVVEPLAETVLYIKTNLDSRAVKATLKPDVLRTFQFDGAEIRFLDVGSVSLILDGEDVGALGVFGEEKTIKFPSLKEL